MSITTIAFLAPRITAWPCRIIISMVTPTVFGRPWTTIPTLSPTSSTSQCSSRISATGAV